MKVLFVAGSGRSGSTVLEQVLALDPRFVGLGEVKQLWNVGYGMNALCGCGHPFGDCPFWREIDERAFGGLSEVDARRLSDIRRAIVQPKMAVRLMLSGKARSGTEKERVAEYIDRVKAVYRASIDATGAEVVIDTSKDPIHGMLMNEDEDIEMHVLHFIRDARGVAYSWSRPQVRPEIYWTTQSQAIYGVSRSAVAWCYRNVLSECLRARCASYRRCRLEDFTLDPSGLIDSVLRDLGLPRTERIEFTESGITLPVVHSTAGNRSRFKRDNVRLQVDSRWRTGLSMRQQWLVNLLAGPLLIRYGYPLGPAKKANVT